MQFWIIHAQENPAEPRDIVKRREWRSNTLSETLSDRGHEVIRWRSAFSHQAKEYLAQGSQKVPHDNYFHQYIDAPGYKRHVGFRRIRHHVALGRNFKMIAARYAPKPDLIHVGNVPIALARAAVNYAAVNGIPVIVDIRDLWPDVYVDLIPPSLGALRRPALAALHATSFGLRDALKKATAISALTPSYLDWALRLAQRDATPDDTVMEMCYPVQATKPPQREIDELRAKLGLSPDHVIACYAGNIGRQSDFRTLMTAAGKLSNQNPAFRMVLAGSGPAVAELKPLAERSGNIVMPGWLSGSELASLMAISSIGLIAYHPVPNYLQNIPNKFPEYLANGLAIACGLGGEMGRLVQDHRCGFIYEPCNAEMLADGLLQLTRDEALLEEQGQRAAALHRSCFDGARIYPRFADYLENIAKAQKTPLTEAQDIKNAE